MRLAAAGLVLAALLAGCGGSGTPTQTAPVTATLTKVDVRENAVVFTFDHVPTEVKARYAAPASVSECGSGAPVRLPAAAVLTVHFLPAITSGVPRRIHGPLELAKFCDFEADVAWAIALERRRAFHVSRAGATVTVSFDG